jgi:hypothetical protein
MNAVKTLKAKITRIASNKDNVRLFIFAYVAWIAATVWIFLEPFPSARTQPDVFGFPRVVACLSNVDVHYQRCATFMNLIAALIAVILRASFVFLAPLILLPLLTLLVLIGATVLQSIGDGNSKAPPANPN